MVDANGQLCLDHRDLDYIPPTELEKVDRWLESTLDDFEAAASHQVGLQISPPYLASRCFLFVFFSSSSAALKNIEAVAQGMQERRTCLSVLETLLAF